MAEPARAFEVVEVDDEPVTAPAKEKAVATDLLMLALKGLSQRAIGAVKDVFILLSVGSAFWVWCAVPDPNVLQIVNNTISGLFCLAANWIVRTRRG
jgi:hypothetical protein